MSILVSNIRQPFDVPASQAFDQARRLCGLDGQVQASLHKVSIDARHGRVSRVYTVQLDGVPDEQQLVERLHSPQVRRRTEQPLILTPGRETLSVRPAVIGLGPAGLFAAYALAACGYRPRVFERGGDLTARDAAVEAFRVGGALDLDSNIQFGEGGAGAYSDGKLTTRIHDPLCEAVLRLLLRFGAPPEIAHLAKPHIGTDRLKGVVRAMREEIVRLGGEVRFGCAVTGVRTQSGALYALQAGGEQIECTQAVLAIGHSARDTFHALWRDGVALEPKPFSVGVRIEHLQRDIDRALYGRAAGSAGLPPAEYALSYRDKQSGRACYSFCMCPGGYVVAAQSEPDTVVVNGMSLHARSGPNANAALAVSVSPADFADGTPFGGVALQRQIERAAFQAAGDYRAPCQTVSDFLSGRSSTGPGRVLPTYPRGVAYGRVDGCLPDFVGRSLADGLRCFGRKIRGFDGPDALLTAPETRTSSPVRIPRGQSLGSVAVDGLLPCGEGAGYAGGIMSAAVDGLRVARGLIERFAPLEQGDGPVQL